MDTHRFFEREAAFYASNHKEGDELKIGLLKELAQNGSSFLDVGCGNGYFADMVLAETNVEWACAVDFSWAMLELNRKVPNKSLVSASVLNMPFKPVTFSLVHADAVLHHLVGATRKASVQQACRGLREIIGQVSRSGFVVLSEKCVQGYLGDTLSSRLIFYALRYLSRTWLAKLLGAPQGLLVSFLTPQELLAGIEAAGGRIVRMEVSHNRPSLLFRLALCKDMPRFHVLVSPQGDDG